MAKTLAISPNLNYRHGAKPSSRPSCGAHSRTRQYVQSASSQDPNACVQIHILTIIHADQPGDSSENVVNLVNSLQNTTCREFMTRLQERLNQVEANQEVVRQVYRRYQDDFCALLSARRRQRQNALGYGNRSASQAPTRAIVNGRFIERHRHSLSHLQNWRGYLVEFAKAVMDLTRVWVWIWDLVEAVRGGKEVRLLNEKFETLRAALMEVEAKIDWATSGCNEHRGRALQALLE